MCLSSLILEFQGIFLRCAKCHLHGRIWTDSLEVCSAAIFTPAEFLMLPVLMLKACADM